MGVGKIKRDVLWALHSVLLDSGVVSIPVWQHRTFDEQQEPAGGQNSCHKPHDKFARIQCIHLHGTRVSCPRTHIPAAKISPIDILQIFSKTRGAKSSAMLQEI